jgi:hypothetical protein
MVAAPASVVKVYHTVAPPISSHELPTKSIPGFAPVLQSVRQVAPALEAFNVTFSASTHASLSVQAETGVVVL